MGSTFASFNFVSKKHKALNILKINLAYKYFVVDHGQIDSNLPLSEYVANLRQYTINRSDIVGRPRKFFFFSFSSPYSLLEPYHWDGDDHFCPPFREWKWPFNLVLSTKQKGSVHTLAHWWRRKNPNVRGFRYQRCLSSIVKKKKRTKNDGL